MKIVDVRSLVYQGECLGLRFTTDKGVFDADKQSLLTSGIVSFNTKRSLELRSVGDSLVSDEDTESSSILDISEDSKKLGLLIKSLRTSNTFKYLFISTERRSVHSEIAVTTEMPTPVLDPPSQPSTALATQSTPPAEISLSELLTLFKESGLDSVHRFMDTIFDRLDNQEKLQRAMLTQMGLHEELQRTTLSQLGAQEILHKSTLSHLTAQDTLQNTVLTRLNQHIDSVAEQNELARQAKEQSEQRDLEIVKTMRSLLDDRRQELETKQSRRWWRR